MAGGVQRPGVPDGMRTLFVLVSTVVILDVGGRSSRWEITKLVPFKPPRPTWTSSEAATRVAPLSKGCDQIQPPSRAGPLPPRAGRT